MFLCFSTLKRIPRPSVVEQTSLESSRITTWCISAKSTKDTSEHALRRAYRLMVKESHPDKGGSHTADFMIPLCLSHFKPQHVRCFFPKRTWRTSQGLFACLFVCLLACLFVCLFVFFWRIVNFQAFEGVVEFELVVFFSSSLEF